MFEKLILLLFIFSIAVNLLAQQSPVKRINSIHFQGLEKTQENYLNQFVQSKVGAVSTDSLLQADIQRLKNIASIGNATYRIDTIDQTLKLVFQIEEIRTLLPILNFGGIKGNMWFQLGFSDINWKGNGSFLNATYQNNDSRHGGQLFYQVTRIKGSDWGFSIDVNKGASIEPLFFEEGTVNYNYDKIGIGLTTIKQIGLYQQLELGGNYFLEKYAKSTYQLLENTPGPDALREPKYLTKVVYKGNYLNYHFFYLKGFSWTVAMQDVYNTLDKAWFHSLQLQGKYFSRIGKKGNLATRLQLGIATNNDSPFAPFVIDSQVNLRGVGNRVDRGTAQIMFNAEYRYTLKETKKWGMQTIAFLDMGTWRNPGGTVSDLFGRNHFRQFIGGGFRIIYKKIHGAILRIDYGMDMDILNRNQGGLVIGLGQYF